MASNESLLLDTCAMIWLAEDEPISATATAEIERVASRGGRVAVSPMSAWELGLLVAKGRLPSTKPPERWFDEFRRLGEVSLEELTPAILIASSFLPPPVHNDPVDRILIATARENGLTIVTRDRAILEYGEAGHVRVLAC